MHLLAQLLPHSPSGKYLTKKTVPAKNFKSSTMRLQGFMGKCLSVLQIQRIFFLEETITTFSNLPMHIVYECISQEYFVLSMPIFKSSQKTFRFHLITIFKTTTQCTLYN